MLLESMSTHLALWVAGGESDPPHSSFSFLPGAVSPGTQLSCQRPHFPLASRRGHGPLLPVEGEERDVSRKGWAFVTCPSPIRPLDADPRVFPEAVS